jgi:hypothetical protein
MRHKERELAAVASIVCGGLVAAAIGGAAWAGTVGLVVIVAFALLLAGSALVERSRRREQGPEVIEPVRAHRREEAAHDAGIVDQIGDFIKPHDVRWLRDETFETPWRLIRMAPFERLGQCSFLPYDPDLDDALRTLVERATDLVAYHETYTFPEGLVREQEWREIRLDPAIEPTAAEIAILEGHRTQLHLRAVRVADAFEEFAAAAERLTRRRVPR